MKIHVSNGNSKLGAIPNISLVPVKDCKNCAACKEKCYALKAWKMYTGVRKAWQENSRLANRKPAAYWLFVDVWLSEHRPKFFRFHVAGDILDQEYLNQMCYMAWFNPQTQFLCFTKRYDLVYRKIPKNLKIVFSMWPGLKARVPKGFSRAWCRDPKHPDSRIPKDALECPGNCSECFGCWGLKGDVVFDIH